MRNLLLIVTLLVGFWPVGPVRADSRCLEFQVAAMQNETETLLRFLEKDIDINCRDPLTSETALMKAAMNGSVEAIDLLIEKGADLGLRSDGGRTALGIARMMRDGLVGKGERFAPLLSRYDQVIKRLEAAGATE